MLPLLQSTNPVSLPRSADKLLLLHGGGGSDLTWSVYGHSVLLGLIANSVAVLLSSAAMETLTARAAQHDTARSRLRTCAEVLVRYLAVLLVTFSAYLIVFHLTGFVPMGYVLPARPLLPSFIPKDDM